MWEKFKTKLALFWVKIQPELYKFLMVVKEIGIDVLLPIAIKAVAQAALQKNLSGSEKFDFATDYVKAQAPDAVANAAVIAVRIAFTSQTGEVSKY